MDNFQRKGALVPISPSQTPRSSDRSSKGSSDSSSNSNSKHDKDKGVNIQVIVRCRPLNDYEMRFNTPVVISCNEQRKEVSAVQNIANKQIDKTFTFDKVFGPSSLQKDLFEQAVTPIVREVLEGYNCTIFAYGQTGTGKTYTMEGGAVNAKNEEFPSDAGVIPRSVRQIFDKLEAQNSEYSMKVTFLELYNEEITDLLAPEELKVLEDKSKKPIALMEDGKGGVFVRGLEEEIVETAGEIYKILEKGSLKRRTAETLLNKQSSRSHSIFSITIHMKECTPEGEEMIKCGKLNLVDLAGSENILRSGARDTRAREAGEINKSLLTLGRVINALVDHSGHVPYRDSKLTRLLRDSLGGKTKTCIVATISPSIHCLEETLNTLDYAHRAKNIKNKPEVNQKMMKSALIKDLYSEIDRIKQELYAAREKNGIYIPKDCFVQDEALKKAMSEKLECLEVELELRDKELAGLKDLCKSQELLHADLSEKLENTQKQLDDKEHSFSDLEQRYKQANLAIKEKEYLISNLLKSEKMLVENAFELQSELESAATDVSGLFSKIERKNKIDDANKIILQRFHSQLNEQLGLLHNTVSTTLTQQENYLKQMEDEVNIFTSAKIKTTKAVYERLERLKNVYGDGIRSMDGVVGELKEKNVSTFGKLNSQISMHSSGLEDCLKNITQEGNQLLNELKSSLSMMEDKLSSFTRQQHEGHLRTVEATRSISKITASFFYNLDVGAAKISKILKESENIRNKQLYELDKKFEECAANEEKEFLIKVEEMLANSNARKKKLGLIILTIQARSPSLKPPPCGSAALSSCQEATGGKAAMLFIGLYLTALGVGGIKGSLPSHGAEQLDETTAEGRRQRSTFFNYFVFSLSCGALIAVTFVVWVEDNRGWQWGFAISTLTILLSIPTFLAGSLLYRNKIPNGSPLTVISKVIVAAIFSSRSTQSQSNAVADLSGNPISSNEVAKQSGNQSLNQITAALLTKELRFLNRAVDCKAAHKALTCSVKEVEEVKMVVKILPIFLLTIMLNCCLAQLSTFSVQQAATMETRVGGLTVPPASLPVFPVIFIMALAPLYDHFIIPLARKLTRTETGITHLQRIGIGLVLSIVAMAVAALVEVKRKRVAEHSGLVDSVEPLPISFFWVALQYLFLGSADLFTLAGLLEFFFTEAPAAMRSLATSLSWVSLAMGYYLSSVLVSIVNSATSHGGRQPWLDGSNLNHYRLERFYWLMCCLSAVNFGHYLFWAIRYKYRSKEERRNYG